MSGIDIFVGNYPVIDWELYDLWVEGIEDDHNDDEDAQ